jgi:transporter family protein
MYASWFSSRRFTLAGERLLISVPERRFVTPGGAMTWLGYAFASALAAAATAILAKVGVEGVPSTLATAFRTTVVLVIAWAMVLALGERQALASMPRRAWIFLSLSGVATGLSWLAYFRALQLGPASRVAPIDKLSLPLTIVLAAVVLGESISWKVAAGVALMTLGALLTLL